MINLDDVRWNISKNIKDLRLIKGRYLGAVAKSDFDSMAALLPEECQTAANCYDMILRTLNCLEDSLSSERDSQKREDIHTLKAYLCNFSECLEAEYPRLLRERRDAIAR